MLPILPVPEFDPGRAEKGAEVADLQRRQAVGIDREEMPLEIRDLNAIAATFDETSGELFAAPKVFFEMGNGHRHHPVTGLDG